MYHIYWLIKYFKILQTNLYNTRIIGISLMERKAVQDSKISRVAATLPFLFIII